MTFKEIHRYMGNINPYSVVAARKRKREASERSSGGQNFVLALVVSMLLREPLSVYLLSNTASRLDQLLFRTGAVLVAITAFTNIHRRGSSSREVHFRCPSDSMPDRS